MASDTNTNSDIDEEALADDVDKHVSQRCPGQSAPAKSTPYPSAPPSNETHYLVIPPDVYRRSPEPGEQNHTHWITLRADADTRQTTPPDQYDKDGRILRLPYNIFDEQVGGLNRWGELGNDDAASLLMARSLLEEGMAALNLASASSLRDSSRWTVQDDYHEVLMLAKRGAALLNQYEDSGVLTKLEEGINTLKNASEFLPQTHPERAVCLGQLGGGLRLRFERLGGRRDIEGAITVHQEAIRLTPDSHPHKPGHFVNLGGSLLCRFEHFGDLHDLNDAITVQQKAIRLIPDDHPQKPTCLNNLGTSFQSRFDRLGDLRDLEVAITVQQQAVRLTPDGHREKPGRLNNLGISFQSRFDRLGDLCDLNDAIAVQQQAVCLNPGGHPDKPKHSNNLAHSFLCRFERLGAIRDLDEAITTQQQAVRLTPDGHPRKPACLTNLGLALRRRFERLSDLGDLNGAITAQQQAVCLTPHDNPDKPLYLTNLGGTLQTRFKRLGKLHDLNTAITAQQLAVCLIPDSHPQTPVCFNNLGISFQSRFDRLGDLGDLEGAITAQQQAVRLTPDGHPEKPGRLSNLGLFFQSRFKHLGDLDDLDEAITVQRQAVYLTPDGHFQKPAWLYNLGISFQSRFERLGDPDSLAQAVNTYSRSANSFGPPSDRFTAARRWATLCFSVQSNKSLDAYSTLVDLLPHVVWLGRTVEQRFQDISHIGDVVTGAVMAAIHFGKFNLALEWAEQGRSIVWGQMLQLRTPLDELRQHHPAEANVLEKISRSLESAAVAHTGHPDPSKDNIAQSLEEVAQAHRRCAEEYDRTLARIRALPGFATFLHPKKATSLCMAATSGPVVIVNAHKARCDALILLPHSSQVSHLPLAGLQPSVVERMPQLVESMQRSGIIPRHYAPGEMGMESHDTLGLLWLHMVEPILRYLKLLKPPTHGEMPHITWCLTGPFNFLPIHAAGLYGTEGQPKIFDYVVSSYTPMLAALLSARSHPLSAGCTSRLLTVSQPATPGQWRLPGVVKEVDAVQALQRQIGRFDLTRLDDKKATVAAVLNHMKECSWIHLACHGVQAAIDSAFILFDGPLTLRDVIKHSFSHTELAFLSACETAHGDDKSPEEAIHLAAGMLMAGYGSVVGTMWSIQDDDGPIIAEKFYKYLIEEAGGDSGKAAYALHYAVAHLRDVLGENNFARWAPFIHLGLCLPACPLAE